MISPLQPRRAETSLSPDRIEEWRRRIREDVSGNYHYHMGIAIEGEGNIPAALAAYQRAIEGNPRLAIAHHRLVDLAKRIGRGDLEEQFHRQAQAVNPGYVADALVTMADERLDRAMLDEGIAMLEQALAASPPDATAAALACVKASAALRLQSRPWEALAWSRKAIALDETLFEAHHSMANSLLVEKDFLGAIHHAEVCVTAESCSATFWYDLGHIYAVAFTFDKARAAYEKAWALNYSETSCRLGLAWLAMAQRDPISGSEVLDGWLTKHPDDVVFLSYRALCSLEVGDLETAQRLQQKALEISPAHPIALCNQGLSLACEGKALEGLASVAAAVAEAPQWPLVRVTAAVVCASAGHHEQAETHLAVAAETQPEWIPYFAALIPRGLETLRPFPLATRS